MPVGFFIVISEAGTAQQDRLGGSPLADLLSRRKAPTDRTGESYFRLAGRF